MIHSSANWTWWTKVCMILHSFRELLWEVFLSLIQAEASVSRICEGALLDGFGASIGNALSLQLAASFVGLIFCALAITLIKTTFWLFCIIFGIGFCSLMAATAPLCKHLMFLTLTSLKLVITWAWMSLCLHDVWPEQCNPPQAWLKGFALCKRPWMSRRRCKFFWIWSSCRICRAAMKLKMHEKDLDEPSWLDKEEFLEGLLAMQMQ